LNDVNVLKLTTKWLLNHAKALEVSSLANRESEGRKLKIAIPKFARADLKKYRQHIEKEKENSEKSAIQRSAELIKPLVLNATHPRGG